MEINKLYNCDCLDLMKQMPDNFVDLTITSPPYDSLRDYDGYDFNFESIAKELYRITKVGGVVVWVVGDQTINGSETLTSFKQAIYFKEQCGFNVHDTMIYARYGLPQNNKRYEQGFEYMFVLSKSIPKIFNPIRQKRKYIDFREPEHRRNDETIKGLKNKPRLHKDTIIYNIWRYAIGGGNVTKDKIAYKHPAIFPEQLAADHIYSWSNENDLIFDPMCGSGTVPKMAIKMKRNWIGSEISEKYCTIANKRIKQEQSKLTLF